MDINSKIAERKAFALLCAIAIASSSVIPTFAQAPQGDTTKTGGKTDPKADKAAADKKAQQNSLQRRGVTSPGLTITPVPGTNQGTPIILPGAPTSSTTTPSTGTTFGSGGRGFGRGGDSTQTGGGLVSMDFRGADINNVLKWFSGVTNWQILPDPSLTGQVTIISPKQITVDQAFQVLQSTLSIRGFIGQFEKHGTLQILKIVPFDAAVKGMSMLNSDGKSASADDLKNQVITQIIPIENVDAKALATELTPMVSKGASIVGSGGTNSLIVTDVAANVIRIRTLVEMLDKTANSNEIRRFALHHADAQSISDMLTSIFSKVFSRGKNTAQAQPGVPGQPQAPVQFGPNGQPMQQAGADRAAIVVIPDTRTNSVFVVGSKDAMEKVVQVINELENPEATALKTSFRQMKYADASDVADTVNAVLSGQAVSIGRQGGNNNNGGASFAQRLFGGGGFGGFGGGGQGGQSSGDPFAKVVGNARTNSLIITATDEKTIIVNDLIDKLDVPIAVEPTTFVIPLKNARAEDMQTLLSQAFGTGTGNAGGGFGNNNNNRNGFGNGNGNNNNNRRQGAGGIGGGTLGGTLGRGGPNDEDLQQGAQDAITGTMTSQGFIPDASAITRAAQFGGFGGFGGGGFGGGQFGGGGGFGGGRGGGQNNLQTPLYARGANGNFVTLAQLRNNVGVVADPNTNSIIVTTIPDNMQYIRQLVDSLDIIPRQVMLEVVIAEATLDNTTKLGFQFDAKGIGKFLGSSINQSGSSNFPVSPTGTAASNITSALNPGAQFGISALNFTGLVQALNQDNRVKILSTPKVFASNNQAALMSVTTRVPYIAGNTSTLTGGTNSTVTFQDVGITLNVTPRITPDGRVNVDVDAVASDLLGFDTISSGVDANGRSQSQLAPRIATREANTSVSVKDGEIVALGGLMKTNITNNQNKIPILGDIPILGHLFRSTTKEVAKTELMIFLVPHIIDSDAANRQMVIKSSKNIQSVIPEILDQLPSLRGDKSGDASKATSTPTTTPKKP